MRPLFCEFVYTRNIGQPCKCNVAVATPDGIIKDARVLRQSDDSFGEFHRGGSVLRQHGYLPCNVPHREESDIVDAAEKPRFMKCC